MQAFLVIDAFSKMTDAVSRFRDVVIVIEVDFFLLEGSDESFSISVLTRIPATRHRNLNTLKRDLKFKFFNMILLLILGRIGIQQPDFTEVLLPRWRHQGIETPQTLNSVP